MTALLSAIGYLTYRYVLVPLV